MTIYFEGNGNTKAVTDQMARDLLICALKTKRDELIADPVLESYEDPEQRDRYLADRCIHGVLSVLNGETEYFPATVIVPIVTDEDMQAAKDAGADHFDPNSGDIGAGMADYWNLVNN